MRNFAYSHLPRKWSDIHGQESAKKILQSCVIKGVKSLPRSMLIHGPSGVGKTAIILLLLRSLRCTGRKEYEVDPCGNCEECQEFDARLSDSSFTDIYWIQPGLGDETVRQRIKTALSAASRGQIKGGRDDHDVMFLVFDEFQEIDRSHRKELLNRSEQELPGNQVCYIMMTMERDRLPSEERLAFTRRGNDIQMYAAQDSDIVEFLKYKFPSIPETSAKLIAKKSGGRYGLSLSYYDKIYQIDPLITPDITAYELNIALPSQRKVIWELMEKVKPIELREAVSKLCTRLSVDDLCSQLIEDVLFNLNKETIDDCTLALDKLSSFLSCPNRTPTSFTAFLSTIMGRKFIKEVAGNDDANLGYYSL